MANFCSVRTSRNQTIVYAVLWQAGLVYVDISSTADRMPSEPRVSKGRRCALRGLLRALAVDLAGHDPSVHRRAVPRPRRRCRSLRGAVRGPPARWGNDGGGAPMRCTGLIAARVCDAPARFVSRFCHVKSVPQMSFACIEPLSGNLYPTHPRRVFKRGATANKPRRREKLIYAYIYMGDSAAHASAPPFFPSGRCSISAKHAHGSPPSPDAARH